MYFDWRTWGIWLIGFIILVIWTLIPIKEFRKLLSERKLEREAETVKVNNEKLPIQEK